jgi:iron complex outermembrane recepter protein
MVITYWRVVAHGIRRSALPPGVIKTYGLSLAIPLQSWLNGRTIEDGSMFAMSNICSIKRRCVTRRAGWQMSLSIVGTGVFQTAFAQVPPIATAQTFALDEIIVTARKVAENVQEVPLSVQVLSADFLDEAAATRLYELQFNIPGLVVNNLGLNGAGFALRGVSDQGGNSLAVATHLDGVYLGNSNLAIARMFDLDRIEVLKGPQGTLYGRNATGGSINFITKSPADALGAEVEVAYGSFDTARAQGHMNLPFEKGAFRLAFIGSEGDGYIRNSIDERRFSENDFWGLRGSLRANVTDRLHLALMAQHVADDGASGELWSPPPAFLVNPADIRLTTVTLANPYLITAADNASLIVEYELGFATLHAVTGYARSEVRDLDDCSGLPFLRGCVRGVRPASYDQWSQEIRFASNGGATLDWLVGGYFFDSAAAIDFHQFLPVVNPNPLNASHSTSEETAYAAFGQVTWHLARRWSITGGLRLSYEENRVSSIGTGIQDSPTLQSAENDWHGTSWRIDLGYTATDDMLVYAGVSTGFKSGGITTTRLPDGAFNSFRPENLTAFEAGVKTRWLDGRLTLNGAAFFYDFEDMQINSVYVADNRVIVEIDNAAKAELYGIDASGIFHLTDRLTVSAGAVWMPKREFVEYRNERTGDTLAGHKLSRAPEWTATAAINLEQPLRDSGNLSWRLEYNYHSAFFFTKENDPLYSQNGFGLLNASLRFESTNKKWYVFASGRNLTNENYFNQVFLQSSPGYPDTYEIGFGHRL